MRYPYTAGAIEQRANAEVQWANERGELRGGDRPIYAITDAANDRARPRVLAVKNVTSHVLTQGRIGYPLALYRRCNPQRVGAVVSWMTNLPASGRLEYGPDELDGQVLAAANAVGEPVSNAMRVVLRDLKPDGRYHFCVVAEVAEGDAEQTSDDYVLDTTRPRVDGIPFGEVSLSVPNTAAVARRAWPVTSGVPLPQGQLGSTENLQLVDESTETVAAQFAPLAEWPDGSIQWVLVDFQTDIPAGGHRLYTLTYGSAVKRTPAATPLQVQEDATRIRIETLPAMSKSDYPSEPDTLEDYVWGYLKDGEYRLRRGEGRSHDIFIDFGSGTSLCRGLPTPHFA